MFRAPRPNRPGEGDTSRLVRQRPTIFARPAEKVATGKTRRQPGDGPPWLSRRRPGPWLCAAVLYPCDRNAGRKGPTRAKDFSRQLGPAAWRGTRLRSARPPGRYRRCTHEEGPTAHRGRAQSMSAQAVRNLPARRVTATRKTPAQPPDACRHHKPGCPSCGSQTPGHPRRVPGSHHPIDCRTCTAQTGCSPKATDHQPMADGRINWRGRRLRGRQRDHSRGDHIKHHIPFSEGFAVRSDWPDVDQCYSSETASATTDLGVGGGYPPRSAATRPVSRRPFRPGFHTRGHPVRISNTRVYCL